MRADLILAIDQSTSATKAMLFDHAGRILHRCNREHAQHYPRPGWIEHDAEEIYRNTLEVIRAVLDESGIQAERVAALAITNQRETALVWDRKTGRPVYNAIVWQCQRGAPVCSSLREQGYAATVKEKTGLVLDPYFSASKIKWILDNVEGTRKRAEDGRLLLGTVDAWLVWKLTEGKVHATDYSNACRTMLFNINDLRWDPQIMELFCIPPSMFPQLKFSDEIFGQTTCGGIFTHPVPISGVMGDSHASLFGQHCISSGLAKSTIGTGSSIMMHIGGQPLESGQGLVTSVAWGRSGKVDYVFEGNVNCTGDTIKWLVDGLELIPQAAASESLALSLQDNGGVYLVPAFTGLGAPYWDNEARASIVGMARNARKAHIVRAACESISYQTRDLLDVMIHESGIELRELRVDGGAAKNRFIMQFQADMLNVPVVRGAIDEASSLGAAFMAGLSVGFWEDLDDLAAINPNQETFTPSMSQQLRERYYSGWKEAVRRTLSKT
jgi:glycerol kinase